MKARVLKFGTQLFFCKSFNYYIIIIVFVFSIKNRSIRLTFLEIFCLGLFFNIPSISLKRHLAKKIKKSMSENKNAKLKYYSKLWLQL